MASRPSVQNPDFEIGIITALPLEAHGVRGVFDQIYNEDQDHVRRYDKALGDINTYTTGRIGQHNVVLAHMPGMGKVTAANVAVRLTSSFTALKLVLIVGVCGGIPEAYTDKAEILLGDIVVGKQVVQHDFGRQYAEGFARRNTESPGMGPEVRSLIAKLESCKELVEQRTSVHLASLLRKPGFEGSQYPGPSEDRLFRPDYLHKHHNARDCDCAREDSSCAAAKGSSCEQLGCSPEFLIPRARLQGLQKHTPLIYFGSIASGDVVIKSGKYRRHVAATENVIAFEMEGAGLSGFVPCVVIKGVCDYSDSHKLKGWQRYAAAAASACTKAILEQWRSQDEQDLADRHVGMAEQSPRVVFNNQNAKIGGVFTDGHFSNLTFNVSS
ncbi:hypothetical protein BDW72DRAFT_188601 [Aspergillus terricola var. indicus]